MTFAGLWEAWTGPNGEEMETAAIVTTTANRTLRPIHDRMPVIIPPDAFDLWLDCGKFDADTAAALIAPAPEDLLEFHEVSTAVNRTANDSAALIEPVTGAEAAAAEPQKRKIEKRAKVKSSTDEGQTSLF
jgi:putative SOS response-associated peptidase YedK